MLSQTSFNGSRIPEAGGLVSAVAPERVNTTVMPVTKDEPTIAGEPGLQVPKDAAAISAFTEINDVDGQKFNEEMSAEEKKKQKKKVKRSQYKAKKKKKAQEAAVNGGDSNTPVGSSAQETSDAEFGSPEPEIPGTFPAVKSSSTEAFERAQEEAESKDAPIEGGEIDHKATTNADKEILPTTLDPRVTDTISDVNPVVAEEIPQPIVTEEAPEPIITVEDPEQVEDKTSSIEPVPAGAETPEEEFSKTSDPSAVEKETDPAIAAALAASTAAAAGLAATEAGTHQPTELKGVAAEPVTSKAAEPVSSKAAEPVTSKAAAAEPVVAAAEPVVSKAAEPVTNKSEPVVAAAAAEPIAAEDIAAEAVSNKAVANNAVAAEAVANKAVAAELVAEKAAAHEPHVAAPEGVEDSVTPEPVTETAIVPVDDAVEKEVDASPVKNLGTAEEEIIVAHGNADEIAAAIVAQEGDVTVEEFKPTDDEAARFAEEVKATAKPAASTANKEKKKPGKFSRFVKKIFK